MPENAGGTGLLPRAHDDVRPGNQRRVFCRAPGMKASAIRVTTSWTLHVVLKIKRTRKPFGGVGGLEPATFSLTADALRCATSTSPSTTAYAISAWSNARRCRTMMSSSNISMIDFQNCRSHQHGSSCLGAMFAPILERPQGTSEGAQSAVALSGHRL
jgi:hypothetical protein